MFPYNILFPNLLQTTRLITANTAEHTDHHPSDEYNHKQIISRFPTVPPSFAAVGWDTEWIDDISLPDVPCHIYVDGSWEASPHTTTLERLMRGAHEPTGSCAVVFIPKTWDEGFPDPITAIRVTKWEAIDIYNVYGTECLANTIALAISNHRHKQEQIYTDCKSLVDSIPHINDRLTKAKSEYAILMASMNASLKETPAPQWIRSHPLVAHKLTWSRRQWGNHIADRIAAGQQRDLTAPVEDNVYNRSIDEPRPKSKHRLLQITTHDMTAKEILPHLIPPNTWYWGDDKGEPLGVQSIKYYLHRDDLTEYTANRDGYRAQNIDETDPLSATLPPYCGSNSIPWAFKTANRGKRSVTEIAHAQRIILDWTNHGRNVQKNATEKGNC